MREKKAVFIINPKAGTKNIADLPEKINSELKDHFYSDILFWEHPEMDIKSIVKENISQGTDIFVAIGGDGTVNKVAEALTGTGVPLGIIPTGSGNGLSRHLKIPLNLKKAIRSLINGNTIDIDTCKINNRPFFCTSGVGFDAYVGKLFADSGKRGFKTYAKIIMSEFARYQPQEYILTIDGEVIRTEAFLVTFANAGQYGNAAVIAPDADICDGYIDVIILKPFRVINSLELATRLYTRTIHMSKWTETYRGKEISLTRKTPGMVHYDGEPYEMGESLDISIDPLSLRVIK